MPDRRVVLILGAGSSGEPLTDDALVGATTLRVLAIGWPLSAEQMSAIERALELARAAGIVLDAILVASPRDTVQHVDPHDRVLFDGSPRDHRRVRRALAVRGISGPAER